MIWVDVDSAEVVCIVMVIIVIVIDVVEASDIDVDVVFFVTVLVGGGDEVAFDGGGGVEVLGCCVVEGVLAEEGIGEFVEGVHVGSCLAVEHGIEVVHVLGGFVLDLAEASDTLDSLHFVLL